MKNSLRRCIASFIIAAASFTSALLFAHGRGNHTHLAEPLTPAKRTQIVALLDATGIRTIADQMAAATVQNMAVSIREKAPSFPARGFNAMQMSIAKGLREAMDEPGGLIEQATMVYHRRFTQAEIEEMLKFYRSPTGKKWLQHQSIVSGETAQVAMRWADSKRADLHRRIDDALAAEQLKLPNEAGVHVEAMRPLEPVGAAASDANSVDEGAPR